MNDLTNTKVGDTLVLTYSGNREIATVTRITKTQVLCGLLRFNRRGHEPGGGWHARYAHPATPEVVAEIKEEQHRKRLYNAILGPCNRRRLATLTTPQLESIQKMLEGGFHETV